jgi:hypothetical protein
MANNNASLDLIKQLANISSSVFGQAQQSNAHNPAVEMGVKLMQIFESLKASSSNITPEQVFEVMIHPALIIVFAVVVVGYIIFLGYNWDSIHFKKK